MPKSNAVCNRCNKPYERCAKAETCENWRLSYEVCIIFGTLPYRRGFTGAATTVA